MGDELSLLQKPDDVWKWENHNQRLNRWLETTIDLPPGCYVVTTTYPDKHIETKLHIKH